MDNAVFDEVTARPNWPVLYETLRAYERLTGREVEAVPESLVLVTAAEAPDLLLEGEHVEFHFGGAPTYWGFRADDVPVGLFTPWGRDDPRCTFALDPVHHEWGEAVYPVRIRIPYPMALDDGALGRVLLEHKDERAFAMFSRMWRLPTGPLVFGRNGEIHEVIVG